MMIFDYILASMFLLSIFLEMEGYLRLLIFMNTLFICALANTWWYVFYLDSLDNKRNKDIK